MDRPDRWHEKRVAAFDLEKVRAMCYCDGDGCRVCDFVSPDPPPSVKLRRELGLTLTFGMNTPDEDDEELTGESKVADLKAVELAKQMRKLQ